jgi:hypothetical protein
MIVIASHDKIDLLEDMLFRLSEINLNNHKVLVVDTNSQDQEYLLGIEKLKLEYPSVQFDRKLYSCYDSGAYLHAYNNYHSEKYIFLQDSLIVENPDFFVQVDAMLDEYDVVPMFNFIFLYDSMEQRSWCEEGLDINSPPTDGIFGPIFAVNRAALDKIPKSYLKEPTSKVEACGMERYWSLIFHLTGATKKYLEYIPHERWNDFWNCHGDFRKNIAKVWMRRE